MSEKSRGQAMQIDYRDINALIPYARNARTHSEEQVSEIASSIREFGFNDPVAVDGENGIIEGHGRVLAAQKLGIKQVPTIELAHLTEAQKRAYILAHNKLTENAGWDQELLSIEMQEIRSAGLEELTGFGSEEINALLTEATPEGNTDEDEVPEEPEEPVTQKGDVWVLGRHRVRCGDSTSADDVAALLNSVEPHLMVTDPPYGVNYDAGWRSKALKDGAKRAEGKVSNDGDADWSEAWSLFPGDVAYVWHADKHSPKVAAGLEICGFEMRALICWAKSRLVVSRGHYHSQHEPCWYAVKNTGHWQGSRKESTLWQIDKPQKSDTGHSTQKPVECMRRPIVNNSAPGQPVYDPFLGSGTMLIAGEKEGRPVYGMELDPSYCDVIVRRWQDFTGQDAINEATGKTFNEVSNEQTD